MKKISMLTAMAMVLVLMVAFPLGLMSAASDGLVAYWAMDDGSGKTATDSANANDGELSGGIDGNAVEFDGNDDVVVVPDSIPLQLIGSFTIEAWIYPESIPIPEVRWAVIVAKWGNTTKGTAGIFFALEGNKLFGRLSTNGSNYFDVTGGTSVTTGAWHHVALVLDTSSRKAKVYLDGALDGTTTNVVLSSVNGNNGIDVTIGAYNFEPATPFDNPFDGKIDEVRISNSVVYPAAVLPATPPLDVSGAVGLWHMDESVGVTAFDATGNSNGTLTNGASWAGPIWSSSLSFDGVDDYVSIPDTGPVDLDGFSGLTLLARIKPEGQGSGPCTPKPNLGSDPIACGGIISKYNTQTSFISYYLATATDELRLFVARDSSNYAWETTTDTNFILGNWYHVAGTWDGLSFNIYVDGVLQTSVEHVGKGSFPDTMINTGVPLNIGRFGFDISGNDFGYFDGMIDEACIFDRALTPVEVALIAGGLPCDGSVGITLAPDGVYNPINSSHTVVATIDPEVGDIPVVFEVTGANTITGSDLTGDGKDDDGDAATEGTGDATFDYIGEGYVGPGIEIDTIKACVDLDNDELCEDGEPYDIAIKKWFDPSNPEHNFCPTSVAQIIEFEVYEEEGVIVSSSIEAPVSGGDVGVYFLNTGPGSMTFSDPAWSVKGTVIPRYVDTLIPLTPTGSSSMFWDRGWGGTFGEDVDLLGCVNFSDIVIDKPGGKGTAHLDLSFTRDGEIFTVRVNVHFR